MNNSFEEVLSLLAIICSTQSRVKPVQTWMGELIHLQKMK